MIHPPQRPISLPLLAVAAGAALIWGKGTVSQKETPRVKLDRQQPLEAGDDRRQKDGVIPLRQIAVTGSKGVLAGLWREVNNDRVLAVAGGVTFFVVMAIFPGIAAFLSLYALFSDPSTIQKHLALAAGIMPTDAFNLLQTEITRIAGKSNRTLGLASLISLAVALWSANGGVKAIIDALNVAHGVAEKRGFIRLNLTSLAFTLGAIFFLLVAVAAVVILPIVLSTLGLHEGGIGLLAFLRWPLLLFLVAAGLSVLFRFGPSRQGAKWHWVTVGSLAASVFWIVASSLLSFYVAKFADYNATYGSLGAVIGLLMWLWLTFVAMLAGAELDSEIDLQMRGEKSAPRSL